MFTATIDQSRPSPPENRIPGVECDPGDTCTGLAQRIGGRGKKRAMRTLQEQEIAAICGHIRQCSSAIGKTLWPGLPPVEPIRGRPRLSIAPTARLQHLRAIHQ